eukprot:CAMPEP_0172589184 /NCGR_PEP_ID=MMETSP1068-20121228/7978_1 /TAXON_ID=35684 /ORGANISM="Pseudopedinella elastica, Strain CCMP716" /LENGTH=211 /DNA_ID=CAMNT_0013384729 /DNA_START=331 /DNA_END=963 /DNA_ORIENTATION=-
MPQNMPPPAHPNRGPPPSYYPAAYPTRGYPGHYPGHTPGNQGAGMPPHPTHLAPTHAAPPPPPPPLPLVGGVAPGGSAVLSPRQLRPGQAPRDQHHLASGAGLDDSSILAAHLQAQCRELQRQLHVSIDAERKAQAQIHQLQLMSKSQTAILRTNLNNKIDEREKLIEQALGALESPDWKAHPPPASQLGTSGASGASGAPSDNPAAAAAA